MPAKAYEPRVATLVRLRQDQSGAVAVLVAICAPVMFLVLGFAIDYAWASYVNQRLARAADASALSSVSQTAATAAGGYSNTYWLQIYGGSIFTENVKQLGISGVAYNLAVVGDGNGGAIATASYNYPVPTFFGALLGKTTITVAGTVVSAAKPLTYVNYYILVDASQSMGIGATAVDMQNLYDRVIAYGNQMNGSSDGCVFGCHVKGPGQKRTNEDLAHNVTPAITLRIDAAVSAIQSIINDAQNATGTIKNIKFALYTIQNNPNTGSYITTVASLSNNYANLTSLAAAIDLGDNKVGGTGDSDFVDELNAFNSLLPSNGSGASATAPLNYVFLITDGVTDIPGGCTSGHCTGPLDATRCSQLKAKATVGVIYTTYLDIYNQNIKANGLQKDYADLVYGYNNPSNSQIAPALQACATSTDYYFEAVDGPQLNSSMSLLFAKTLPSTARLIQ